MSYILDALKKSESERYQDQAQNSDGFAQPLWLPKKKRSSPWPWIIGVALLLNGVLVSWLIWRMPVSEPGAAVKDAPTAEINLARAPARQAPSEQALQETAPESPVPKSAPAPAPVVPEPAAPVQPAPVQTIPEQPTPEPAAPIKAAPVPAAPAQAASEPVTAAPPDDIPLISDLPADFQRQIPALRFSSHIYSSSPEARRIMINNRYLREGQSVQGLRVVEVTPEGVILALRGRVFEIPVLRDWTPDER